MKMHEILKQYMDLIGEEIYRRAAVKMSIELWGDDALDNLASLLSDITMDMIENVLDEK
jgi:hypothetical protein